MTSPIIEESKKDLSKREYALLGKIFASDIEAALSKQPRVFQTRSKLIHSLKDKGMVKEVEERLGGRFPVVIRGWELTLLGNLMYCMSCGDPLIEKVRTE